MRRGQAALEYLSTYGWAIMVVLIAIGALSYFGVTNPKNLLPETCTVSTGFSCIDHRLTSGAPTTNWATAPFKVFVSNNLGTPVTIQASSLEFVTSKETVPAANCRYQIASLGTGYQVTTGSYTLGTEDTLEISCSPSVAGNALIKGNKDKVSFSFDYIEVGGRYPHSISGEFLTEVQ